MKLFEHPEFEQAVLRATEHFRDRGLRPAIVEKDYYVTEALDAHPALTFLKNGSRTIGGFGRSDRFSYVQRFGGPGEVAGHVLMEAGTASGREPTEVVQLRSYLGTFPDERGLSLGAEDEGSFPMCLLHFRRTFVEKLFAIHGKVELLKRDGRPLGSYARHYYDLFHLAAREEVVAMLASDEYTNIKDDYDANKSRSLCAKLLRSGRDELRP